MKVIGVAEFGAPEVLTAHEVPEPHAGPGEARIRVHAAAVSPTDTVLRAAGHGVQGGEPPYVPGMDAAGVVDEVGDDTPWQVGDQVMAMAIPRSEHGGAYTEHLVGAWESMARTPSGTDVVAACTLPMNGLTAHQSLDLLGLDPGQTLGVTGAAGMLGNYTVQLAKHAGLTVVADAADKDRELVESLGADYVVARGDDVADRIREVVPDGVDGLVDAALLNEKVVHAVRDEGGFVTVRGWRGMPERDIAFHPVLVVNDYRSHDKLDRLRRLVEAGALTPRVAYALPADDAAEAHRRLEAGGVRGRIVLTF